MSDATLYDADAVIAALEPPRLKFRGEVHTGRLLSWKEMQAWNAELDALIGKGVAGTDEEYASFARRLLDAMDLPGAAVLEMPIAIAWDAVNRFLRASRAAPTRPEEAAPPPTPGSSSPSAGSGSVPPG